MGLIPCAACGEPDAAAALPQRNDYEGVPLCESCRAHFHATGVQQDMHRNRLAGTPPGGWISSPRVRNVARPGV